MFYKRKGENTVVEVVEVRAIRLSLPKDDPGNTERNRVYLRDVVTDKRSSLWKDAFTQQFTHIPEEDVELALLANV